MIQWLIIVEVNKKRAGIDEADGWGWLVVLIMDFFPDLAVPVGHFISLQGSWKLGEAVGILRDQRVGRHHKCCSSIDHDRIASGIGLGRKTRWKPHEFFQLLAPVRSPPLKPKVQRRTMRIWRHMLRRWECAEANIPELSKPRLQTYWTKPIKKLSEFWVFHLYFSIFHIFNDPCNIISLS